MREHIVNKESIFVMGWYIDPSICDRLIEYYNSNPHLWEEGISKTGVVDYSIKQSTEIHLTIDQMMPMEYTQALKSCVDLYMEKWKAAKTVSLLPVEGMNIQKYPAGGGFKVWHHERDRATFPNCNRHLVFMTYLNDVKEGGGTEFAYQREVRGEKALKAEKGLTVLWPADWTHTHRGIVAPNEEKIIATGWLHLTNTEGD
jgi:hypothetical protein